METNGEQNSLNDKIHFQFSFKIHRMSERRGHVGPFLLCSQLCGIQAIFKAGTGLSSEHKTFVVVRFLVREHAIV